VHPIEIAVALACQGVFNVGCSGWGQAYPPVAEITSDAPAAVALSTKACDAGELTSCVNLGAFICAFVCGTLGEKVGWHWGFGSAAVGMLLGLFIYVIARPLFLKDVGDPPPGLTAGLELPGRRGG